MTGKKQNTEELRAQVDMKNVQESTDPVLPRLSVATLKSNNAEPRIPRESLKPGIVHLGFGAFARAHTAVYTERAMLASGDFSWGIIAVTQRSNTVINQLRPQDCLYTVVERGEKAASPYVISGISDTVSGIDQPMQVVNWIAAESIKVVTLTVTEKGYRIAPNTGSLNFLDPQIQADLSGNAPRTAIGQIVRGLQKRMNSHGRPITVVSCDNLPNNGALTQRLVLDFVSGLPRATGEKLASWIQDNVAFPNTMVDRMVPATTSADIEELALETGAQDLAAVVAEPFIQWVIEDHFAAARPPWKSVGAVFSNEVELWEAAKLRLLNAGHSMLAYLGLGAGLPTIAEACNTESFNSACRSMMLEDVIPTLRLPAGLNADVYCEQILSRFANSALGHTTAKVGSDGSQKLGPRLLTTIRSARACGEKPVWATLAIAAWANHVLSTEPGKLDDPLGNELQDLVAGTQSKEQAVARLLGYEKIFDQKLGTDKWFVESVQDHFLQLSEHQPYELRRI